MSADPLSVICPLCGAWPGEECERRTPEAEAAFRGEPHLARIGEAARARVLRAEPTADLGRWATLEERAGR